LYPFLLLHPEELQPAAQLGKGDGETFAEPLHCGGAQEVLSQDTEDKEQAVAGVGDDEVREDGMGMAAGTDEAHDAEAVADGGAAHKVHQEVVIVRRNRTGPLMNFLYKFGMAWDGQEGNVPHPTARSCR